LSVQTIRPNAIKIGQTLEVALYMPSGQKLLPAGVTIASKHLEAIRRCGAAELLLAEHHDDLVEAGVIRQVNPPKLRAGQRARRGLMSREGQTIIARDDVVEKHHVEALKTGGAFVSRKKAQPPQRRELILMGDAAMDRLKRQAGEIELRITPCASPFWNRVRTGADWPPVEQLAAEREQAVEAIAKLQAKVEAGVACGVDEFRARVDPLLETLGSHPRQFTHLALLTRRHTDHLPGHAYTVAVLAMAVAAQLNWSKTQVREIGIAALLADLGMLLVPERIRTGTCELSEMDRSRVQRHPVHSLALLECVSDVDPALQLAVVQHHERENGTGYPHGARKARLSDYARVLGVCDTFAATTEPRSYRTNKLPYTAMEEMLRHANTRILWPDAARALVQVAGLFPVGSYVKLTGNVTACVVRSHPKAMDRPVVQPVDASGEPTGEPIDLATMAKSEMAVIRASPPPPAATT